jgi:hypothetical protein
VSCILPILPFIRNTPHGKRLQVKLQAEAMSEYSMMMNESHSGIELMSHHPSTSFGPNHLGYSLEKMLLM